MKLSGAVAAAPGGKAARGAVVVGTLAAAQVGAGLLPPPVLRRVVPAGVAPLRVRVGQPASTGYRYDRVTTPDRATMSIVVVATSAGVATVECLAGSAANSAVPPACDGIFASLSIRGVRRFAPGPSNAYRDAVARELAVLGHAVSRGDLAMRGTAAKRQAAGAMTVARALQRAGEVVSGLVVSPGDWHFQRELTRSFAAGKQGYLRLATAARRADAPGHARAVTAIRHAFAAVDSALVDMARAGYPRLLLAAPALPALTRERHHASSPGTAVVTPPAAGHALTPAASPTPAPPVVHPTPVPTPVVPRPTPITGGSG